jgi:predicted nuclease with TOPRIM domain
MVIVDSNKHLTKNLIGEITMQVKKLVKNIIKISDALEKKDTQLLYQEKIIDGLRSEVKTLNDIIEEKKLEVKPKDYTLEELRKEKDEALDEGVSLSNQLESLKEQLEEKEELINKLSKEEQRWRKAYARDCYTQGWRYVFSEIPNDTEGQEFVDTCKKYLNRESYILRVKGQHIKDELKGQGRTAYGQNLSESSCMRIYIDTKKGE